MTFAKRRHAAALTMVEIVLAILIVTIVIVGCSMLFASGRAQIKRQKTYRAAVQLACQKLEYLKGQTYSSLTAGDATPDTNSIDGVSYTRNTHIEDGNSCKTVRVTVHWGASNDPNVSLITIIAP